MSYEWKVESGEKFSTWEEGLWVMGYRLLIADFCGLCFSGLRKKFAGDETFFQMLR